jgi:hypothetical protein
MSESLSIQNKEGKLRAKPSFLGKVIIKLPYGTKVIKVEEQLPWIKVKHNTNSGWLHKDALTEKEIVVKSGDNNVKRGASDDELVLAGKGFSESVEKGYRKNNPKVEFTPVDHMEKFSINEESMTAFLKEGGLV